MNIVLCTDNNYANACGVCLTSLLENNKDISCNVYILTDWLSEENKTKFQLTEKKYSQKIEIVIVTSLMFEGLKVSDRFPKSIYYRFLIPDLLTNETKALYLDCDIIVDGSLKLLENFDLSDYACGVVIDQMSDDVKQHNRIDLPMSNKYFNSGVLLMNLEYWRNNNVSENLIRFISSNPEQCIYPDQDALNIILANQVRYLPIEYNCQQLFFEKKISNLLIRKDEWANIEKAIKKPFIIHFTKKVKPWHSDCVHPLKDIFGKYERISKFKIKKKPRYSYFRRLFFSFCDFLVLAIRYTKHLFE